MNKKVRKCYDKLLFLLNIALKFKHDHIYKKSIFLYVCTKDPSILNLSIQGLEIFMCSLKYHLRLVGFKDNQIKIREVKVLQILLRMKFHFEFDEGFIGL